MCACAYTTGKGVMDAGVGTGPPHSQGPLLTAHQRRRSRIATAVAHNRRRSPPPTLTTDVAHNRRRSPAPSLTTDATHPHQCRRSPAPSLTSAIAHQSRQSAVPLLTSAIAHKRRRRPPPSCTLTSDGAHKRHRSQAPPLTTIAATITAAPLASAIAHQRRHSRHKRNRHDCAHPHTYRTGLPAVHTAIATRHPIHKTQTRTRQHTPKQRRQECPQPPQVPTPRHASHRHMPLPDMLATPNLHPRRCLMWRYCLRWLKKEGCSHQSRQ